MNDRFFVPEGDRIAFADKPYIIGWDRGKTRVFRTMPSGWNYGWCWKALPYEGPKHNAVMAFFKECKEKLGEKA